MISFRILSDKSHFSDIEVQFKNLDIDKKVDSCWFYDYLKHNKPHIKKSEILSVYLIRCLDQIINLGINKYFIFYFNFYDQYTGGVKVVRESIENFSIQKIITHWGALDPHSIDGNQTLEYKLQGPIVLENRKDFLLGLLQSIEELLRANDKTTS